MAVQVPVASTNIVDILVAQGDLAPERAEQVKLAEVQTGKPLEDIIREQKVVSEEALIRARATFYNIGYVDLRNMPVNPAALSLLSQEVSKKFKVFPISADASKKELQLAMADPLDLTTIEFVEQKTGYHVRPFAAVPDAIDEFVAKRYSTTLSQEVTAALKEVSGERKINVLDASMQQGGLIRPERIS